MSPVALAIVSLSGSCTAGFGFACYASLLVMDATEIDELKQQGRFVANNWTRPDMIVRHWQTRPQVRRALLFAIISGIVLGATLVLDSYFASA